MYQRTVTPVPSIALSSATGSVGTRQTTKLLNNTQTHFVRVKCKAVVTISAASITAWRNRASCMAMISQIGLVENGAERINLEGRDLRALSEVMSPSALSATRPTALVVAAYTMEEEVLIPLAQPNSVNPRETAFRELDPTQPLEVFAVLAPDWESRICTKGGATVTLTSFTLTVQQEHDPYEKALPYFIPRIRQWTETISAANSQYTSFIRSPNYIRGILISQDTDVGECSDAITAFAIRDDFRAFVGPAQVPWDDFARSNETRFGGSVYPSTAAAQGYGYLDFQSNGRLPNIMNPAQNSNLRFEGTVAPSATAGATVTRVRFTVLELVKDLTVVNGRPLIDPNPPFDV